MWDIQPTEGKELPQLDSEVKGDVGGSLARLVNFTIQQGIKFGYSDNIAAARGMSYGGAIRILPNLSEAEQLSTLVHELAHEMLHKSERRHSPPRLSERPKPKQWPLSSVLPPTNPVASPNPPTDPQTALTQSLLGATDQGRQLVAEQVARAHAAGDQLGRTVEQSLSHLCLLSRFAHERAVRSQ